MTMLNEVNQTIDALQLEDADAAALELARTYAQELDGAAVWRARADKAAKAARELDPDGALIEEMEALRAKLSERAALVQIGRLLHALLAELNATPKARGGFKAPPSKTGTLHRLRSAT
jgi:hypothetical protein